MGSFSRPLRPPSAAVLLSTCGGAGRVDRTLWARHFGSTCDSVRARNHLPVSPKTRQGRIPGQRPQSTDTGPQKTRFLFGYWNLAAAPLSMPLTDTSTPLADTSMVCPWFVHGPNRSLFGYSFADTDSHADRDPSKTDTGRIGTCFKMISTISTCFNRISTCFFFLFVSFTVFICLYLFPCNSKADVHNVPFAPSPTPAPIGDRALRDLVDEEQDEGAVDQRHPARVALGAARWAAAAAPAVHENAERHEAEARGALGPLTEMGSGVE